MAAGPTIVPVDQRMGSLAAFILLCGCSLGLLNWLDGPLYGRLQATAPAWAIIADVRLPSLLVCAFLYGLTGPAGSYRLPRALPWRPALRLSLMWLVPAAVCILILRVWVPTLLRTEDVVAYMVTGLMAEELLFRGAVYRAGERLFGNRQLGPLPLSVVVSAFCFALSHLQYHGFAPTPAAMTQVAYTLAAGIFLGLLRVQTGSIWPPVAVHALTNLLTLLR